MLETNSQVCQVAPAIATNKKRERSNKGGRTARIQRRLQQSKIPCKAIKRRLPAYDILNADQVKQIADQADWLLQRRGIVFHDDPEALDILAAAGARIEGNRAHFEAGLAKHLCRTAPSQFTLYGREAQFNAPVGGDNVIFTPAYGSPFVRCLEKGRRYATLEDFTNFIKLSHSTPYLHHSGGTVCEPVDIDVNHRHLDMVYAHLRYSSKPFMGSVTAPERAEDSIAMAQIAFGKEFLDQHCVIQGNINANSPLSYDGTMTKALKAYAAAGQGIVLSPFIIGGAMGPVTIPALVAQSHAEAMVGIALSQLIRPGTSVVYGNFLSTMNLQTGAPTFGTPEANLAALAVGQMSRELNLPLRCGGQLTAAKTADGQAMQESSDTMNSGLQAGSHYVLHAAGWLEGGLTMGYEKFVMDLDHCGMLHRYSAGLDINPDSLAGAAYEQTRHGENFLGIEHTLTHFENANYQSNLVDTQPFETWSANGCADMELRAQGIWQSMLANYQEPPMEAAIERELQAFMQDRKAFYNSH
ncbi:MAG TPA: trimethylamine methyltransferase [Oceanospirillaceae bacterium]|nr:trimethylamine methyltransferase [Oceanospirillaceae bacterium]